MPYNECRTFCVRCRGKFFCFRFFSFSLVKVHRRSCSASLHCCLYLNDMRVAQTFLNRTLNRRSGNSHHHHQFHNGRETTTIAGVLSMCLIGLARLHALLCLAIQRLRSEIVYCRIDNILVKVLGLGISRSVVFDFSFTVYQHSNA